MQLFAKKTLASITAPLTKLLANLDDFIASTKAEIEKNGLTADKMDEEHTNLVFKMNVDHNTAMNKLYDRNDAVYQEQTYAMKLREKLASLVA